MKLRMPPKEMPDDRIVHTEQGYFAGYGYHHDPKLRIWDQQSFDEDFERRRAVYAHYRSIERSHVLHDRFKAAAGAVVASAVFACIAYPAGQTGAETTTTGTAADVQPHLNRKAQKADRVGATDPSPETPDTLPPPPPEAGQDTPIKDGWHRVVWVNVLGYKHSTPRGNKPWMPDGRVRMQMLTKLILDERADLAMFGEFEPQQDQAFLEATHGTWGAIHPKERSDDTVAYDKSVWKDVSDEYPDENTQTTVITPTGELPGPIAYLEDKETGRMTIVLPVHNQADTQRYHNQGSLRDKSQSRQGKLGAYLSHKFEDANVLLGGDLNNRLQALQYFTKTWGMDSPFLHGPGRTPRTVPVDQIFGLRTKFRGYKRVMGGIMNKITDHRNYFVSNFKYK